MTIQHVKRDANEVAHRLAKMAQTSTDDTSWVEFIPPCIRDIVLSDQGVLEY